MDHQKNTTISLLGDHIDDISKVSEAENDLLTSIFTEDEVKEGVFQMEHNKGPVWMDSLENYIKSSWK